MRRFLPLLPLLMLVASACGVALADIPAGTTIVMTAPIAQGPCVQSDIALITPADALATIENGNIVLTWNSTLVPTNQPVQFNLILAAATPCLITGAGVFVTTNGVRFTPITVTAADTGKNLTVTLIAPATLPTTTNTTTTTTSTTTTTEVPPSTTTTLPAATTTTAPVVTVTPSLPTTTVSTASTTTTLAPSLPINGPAVVGSTTTTTLLQTVTATSTPFPSILPPTL